MYKFGQLSQQRIATLHPDLQDLLDEAIQLVDFTVLCGHRGQREQTEYYNTGRSKVKYPNSKHNLFPSRAVDIAPYPVDWNDIKRFAQLGGIMKGLAHAKGIKIRCGFDWDSDGDITDHKFMDWPHIELVEE